MAKGKKVIVRYLPDETVIRKIYVIRGHKVMLDYDLAALYEVGTKRLNEQVKRNIERFPEDFMFRLTKKEWDTVRSQIATASQKKRNVNITPYAFTEHGVTMLASILKSEKAVKMSIVVVRAFIELTKSALQYGEITKQLQSLKEHLGEHDVQLNQIYDAIENLLDEKAEKKNWEERRRIGFK